MSITHIFHTLGRHDTTYLSELQIDQRVADEETNLTDGPICATGTLNRPMIGIDDNGSSGGSLSRAEHISFKSFYHLLCGKENGRSGRNISAESHR